MRKEIRDRFSKCEACLHHTPSKQDPPYNGIPGDLTLTTPNEVVSLDFVNIMKKDILVVKDQSSGFIWARLTPNKETKTVI